MFTIFMLYMPMIISIIEVILLTVTFVTVTVWVLVLNKTSMLYTPTIISIIEVMALAVLVLLLGTIYKCENSSNENGDNSDSNGDNRGSDDNNREYEEEESFEIEREIEEINKLLDLTKNARKLDEKLPESEKEKNSHLNDLRKDPLIQNHLQGDPLNLDVLPELKKDLEEAKSDREKELSEAIKCAENEFFNSRSFPQDSSDIYPTDFPPFDPFDE